jgi:tetratricopeptide (TPR) repeat protein
VDHARGRAATAEPYARRALEIRERTLGPDHVDLTGDLTLLATILDRQRRYTESEPLYRRALALLESAGGVIPEILQKLGTIRASQGDPGAAEGFYQRALALQEAALGPDHPDAAITVQQIADLYRGQGRLAEAQALYERALQVFSAALGPEHPRSITARGSLKNLKGGGR